MRRVCDPSRQRRLTCVRCPFARRHMCSRWRLRVRIARARIKPSSMRCRTGTKREGLRHRRSPDTPGRARGASARAHIRWRVHVGGAVGACGGAKCTKDGVLLNHTLTKRAICFAPVTPALLQRRKRGTSGNTSRLSVAHRGGATGDSRGRASRFVGCHASFVPPSPHPSPAEAGEGEQRRCLGGRGLLAAVEGTVQCPDQTSLGIHATHPTHTRALRNMRSQGEASPQSSGCQLIWTLRNTRSGWGMAMVTRPSVVVRAVMPNGEPLGLAG